MRSTDGAPSDSTLFLDAVRSVAGHEGELVVQKLKGGTSVRVPRVAGQNHWLARALGAERANEVCRALRVLNAEGRVASHPIFTIPIGPIGIAARGRANAESLLLDGMGVRGVAIKVGLHERTVSRLRARLVAEGKLQRLSQGRASA